MAAFTTRISEYDLPDDFVVVDLEVHTNKEGKFRAIDGSKPYLIGVQRGGTQFILDTTEGLVQKQYEKPFKVLCGHNLKFDLEHIRRHYALTIYDESKEINQYKEAVEFIRKKATVLDTQFVTYLHSGHRITMGSLEECCAYWGVPLKKSVNLEEELEKVDYDITKVPGIISYLFNDLDMTSALVIKILQDPWVINNFGWILKMHDGYLGTHEIEYNGMHVEPLILKDLTEHVKEKLDYVHDWLVKSSGCPSFSPASSDDVAAYLFGGEIEVEERVKVGVYASGKKMGLPRYKINRTTHVLPRLHIPLASWVSPKTGKTRVSEDILESIDTPFTRSLLEYRELAKLHGTYLEGLSKHIRIKDDAYYVFPQINTCLTATGRTSSSKPNMQNNPTHDSVGVASIYTSRYKDAGILLEVDFKQIEVVALAILSGDPVLIDDLKHGRDIHAMTGEPVFGKSMTKEQRRIIKTINFGLIYGGSANTLSKQAKVAKHIASKAIDSFYERYKGVRKYFDELKTSLQIQLDISGDIDGYDDCGRVRKRTVYESPTGRRYTFKDFYSDWTKKMEISHTETRNYPIQGLATGDLVLTALGDVWRKVLGKYTDSVKLVGLVHDSLRFDIKACVLDQFVQDLKVVLENSGNSLNRAIHKELWTLPVNVTFAKGASFFKMEEFEVCSMS